MGELEGDRGPPFLLIWRIFIRHYVRGMELGADIVTDLKLMV